MAATIPRELALYFTLRAGTFEARNDVNKKNTRMQAKDDTECDSMQTILSNLALELSC